MLWKDSRGGPDVERGPRFSVITIQNVTWSTLLERWQYLEELGFDSAWVADHFTNYRKRRSPGWSAGRFFRPSPPIQGGYASGRWSPTSRSTIRPFWPGKLSP